MNLYGQDMDESTTPWVAGLAWTVALDEAPAGQPRQFIGRAALVLLSLFPGLSLGLLK